jgi:hypothetical protein
MNSLSQPSLHIEQTISGHRDVIADLRHQLIRAVPLSRLAGAQQVRAHEDESLPVRWIHPVSAAVFLNPPHSDSNLGESDATVTNLHA